LKRLLDFPSGGEAFSRNGHEMCALKPSQYFAPLL